MANKFEKEFIDYYIKKKKDNYIFFEEQAIIINNEKKFNYLKCNIDRTSVVMALKIAKEKSKHTMSKNQAGFNRNQITKIIKSSQGILAEMFLHILLLERYKLNTIRYDLERKTFEYSIEEYDIKIIAADKNYEVESRSSIIRNKTIKQFIENDFIIGPYYNKFKEKDEVADFHFRPVYFKEYKPLIEINNKFDINPELYNGTTKLIISGCATKEEMIKHSIIGTLGQKGTKYNLIKVEFCGDISIMDIKLQKL